MIITIIAFLFILAFSITIHELGHFIIAKVFRIPVEKFSIGFGPPMLRKKIGETDFRIAYFPLGGYVKMAGEDEGEITSSAKKLAHPPEPMPSEPKEPQTVVPLIATTETPPKPGFYDAPIHSRILVVFSGSVFNIISAFALFAFIHIIFGVNYIPFLNVKIQSNSIAEKVGFKEDDSLMSLNGQQLKAWEDFERLVSANRHSTITIAFKRGNEVLEKVIIADPDSLGLSPKIPPLIGSLQVNGPAHKAGLRVGDRILSIDGETIKTWDELVEKVRKSKNVEMNFQWQRGNQILSAKIMPLPSYDPQLKDTIGQINVMIPSVRKKIPLLQSVKLALNTSYAIVYLTLKTFYKLITRQISTKALGGPIAIFRYSGEAARWGIERLLFWLGVISINLGLVNLFPIPAFDGGHIIVALIEGIRRKRFTRRTRLVIQQVGYVIMLLIIVYVTFNDITR